MKTWLQKQPQHVLRDLGKHVRILNVPTRQASTITNQDDPSNPKKKRSSTDNRSTPNITFGRQRLDILHLYRALLRECTYLPHPRSRPIISSHISTLFHRHAHYPSLSTSPNQQSLRTQHIHFAHTSLHSLRRANHGHTVPLEKVLSLTYARSGSRRWSLLSPLTIPYENLADITTTASFEKIPALMPQLHALIRSQGPETGKRRVFRNTLPEMEERDIWGRRMPSNRVRNGVRRWYADVLGRVQVPLPKEEWEGLKEMVMGDGEGRGDKEIGGGMWRRKRVGESMEASVKRWKGGVNVTEERMDESGFKKRVVTGAETYKSMRGVSRPHALKKRYLRRMLMSVLKECPMMEEVDGEWKVNWFDEREEPSGTKNVGTRMMGMEEMFEGVDDRGRIIRSETPEETEVKRRWPSTDGKIFEGVDDRWGEKPEETKVKRRKSR